MAPAVQQIPPPISSPVVLDPPSLAARWGEAVTVKTLAKWRMKGAGPKFLKLGSKVVYPLREVEAWEAQHLRQAAG